MRPPRRPALALFMLLLVARATGADALDAGFATPPLIARSLVWWHWINGNVTKHGIEADLADMGGNNAADFVGFSPESLTAGLNYFRPRFSVTVVPGTSTEGFIPPSTYDYQAAYTSYGLSAEYALTKKFALYVNWDDVLAKDRFVYRRAQDTPAFAQTAQRYVSPSFIVIGLKGSF